MAHFRLGGRKAAETAGQAAQLAHIRGEHLEQRIREPKLKDAPRDDGVERPLPHHQPRPRLLAAHGLRIAHGVGVVGGEAGGHVQAVDLVLDRVGAAGGHALHLHLHGEAVAGGVLGLAEQNRVVPRLAGHGRAVGAGALGHEVGQLGAHRQRADAQMEGQVLGVDAQVAHAAVVAVDGAHALPVDGLVQIHVRGMADGEARLDDAAEGPLAVPFHHLLHGGIVGKLAGAAHEHLRVFRHGGLDRLKARQVHAEGLFAQEVLARADHVAVDLRVQVVGHGTVHRLHLGVFQKLMVILIKIPGFRHALKPRKPFGRGIARRHDHGAGQVARQVQPAHGHAGEFPSHQPAADDAEAYLRAHASASSPSSAASNSATSPRAMSGVVISGSLVSAAGEQLGL